MRCRRIGHPRCAYRFRKADVVQLWLYVRFRPIADIDRLVDCSGMASNRHADPFRRTWRDWLLEVAGSWKVLALAALLIAAVAGAALTLTRAPEEVEAQVIRFGSYATDEGNKPILVVRLGDGTVQQVRARRSEVRSCRVGGTVQLLRRGSLLALQPGGCLDQ